MVLLVGNILSKSMQFDVFFVVLDNIIFFKKLCNATMWCFGLTVDLKKFKKNDKLKQHQLKEIKT